MKRRAFIAACGAGAAAAVLPAVPKHRIGALVNTMHVDTSGLSAGMEAAAAALRVVAVRCERIADEKWRVTIQGEADGGTAEFMFNTPKAPRPEVMHHMLGQEIRGFATPPDSFSVRTVKA